jgi:hypothetical protein
MAEGTREERDREREGSWKKHIKSWAASGLTQAEYCRQNNLLKHRFTYWRYKRHKEKEPMRFLPVYPAHTITNPSSNSSGLKILIRDRYRIEVEDGFSEDVLHKLMAALERVI